jgi:hypothetical protein
MFKKACKKLINSPNISKELEVGKLVCMHVWRWDMEQHLWWQQQCQIVTCEMYNRGEEEAEEEEKTFWSVLYYLS